MEEILEAVERINADYERRNRMAMAIAREYSNYDVVLTRLLSAVGLS